MEFVKNMRSIAFAADDAATAKQNEITALDRDRDNYTKSGYAAKRAELVRELEEIRNTGYYRLNECLADYKSDLKRRFSAQGKDITDDAKVLTAEMSPSKQDLEALIDKYRETDNVTMLRMIHDYAAKHTIYIDRAFYDEETRCEAADNLRDYLCQAIGSGGMAAALIRNDAFWNNSIVHPSLQGE